MFRKSYLHQGTMEEYATQHNSKVSQSTELQNTFARRCDARIW